MRNVILIAGVPGVGKSTLAHEIARRANGAVLDVDVFKREVVDPTLLAEQIDPPEVRWKYYSATLEAAFRVFERNAASTVVIDEVFHLEGLRQRIEALCRENDAKVLWVEVVCPYDLVEGRLQAKARDGHILSSEKTLEMYRRFEAIFEPFSSNGNHLLLRSDDGSPEELAELVLARMQ